MHRVYTTTLRAIIPLPDPTAPAGSPAHVSSYQEYPAGSTVMALYPDTTCFYPAEVTATPKDLQPPDRVSRILCECFFFSFVDVQYTGTLIKTHANVQVEV